MDLQDLVSQSFRTKFGQDPEALARAPGRVNLLGEHVDYNDGFVLPAAIDRETWVAFSRSEAESSTILALDFSEQACFTSGSLAARQETGGRPLPGWAYYPAGVAWALADAGLASPALNAVISSRVPRGAGLSSSASVEMAFLTTWSALGGWKLAPMASALLCQKAENSFVGVQCGIMDPFACACGRAGHLLLLDCRSLEWQALPLPEAACIVIADTTRRRSLTGSDYNERREACQEAVVRLSETLPGIRALRDVSLEDFNQAQSRLPGLVARRARHVVEEIDRTRCAVPLLERGDMAGFGRLMLQSHASLRDLYEVSTPELDAMVEVATGLPGCYGARLTGAGFGGCTVNLVERTRAEAFCRLLAAGYQARTRLTPEIYLCQASDGARLIGENSGS